MTIEQQRLYTVAEFDAFRQRPENQDRLFELIHGEIVEKVVTEQHGKIAARILAYLVLYVDERSLGHAVMEVSYRVPGDEHNDRQPDVSVRITPDPALEQGAVPMMPDLAVEVKSPTNTYKALREKANYYLANGTQLVWLVYPQKHTIEIYHPDKDIEILQQGAVLTGGDLLPDFALSLARIFQR